MKRKGARKPPPRPWLDRLAFAALWTLFLVPPLLFDPMAKDSFRLPKELLAESLALASLLLLCARLRGARPRGAGRLDWRRLPRHPAIAATLPLAAVASLGWLASDHPLHVRQGWTSLAIGIAAVVGWSLALTPEERRRLLAATIVPATLLSLILILQFHEIWDPFQFASGIRGRRTLTSFAGGAYDLGAYLVLPVLIAQVGWFRATEPRKRWAWGVALLLCAYALASTQTLTALAAVALASAVLWAFLIPPRRLLAAVAILAVVGGALAVGVKPLRVRITNKAENLAAGNVNLVLTGRLDGWRAALRMMQEHPWLGVGVGAFTTEFAAAKLALAEEGVEFFARHIDPHFASAHSDFLEVAAECGALGFAALGWGLWVLVRALRRKTAAVSSKADPAMADVALMCSATAALAVLALGTFPLHLAIVAYPHLLLLGWVLAEPRGAAPPPEGGRRQGGDAGGALTGRLCFWLLLPLLAVALTLQVREAFSQWRASRVLAAVETVTQQASRNGRLPPQIGNHHLRLLSEAAALNPAQVDVPVARGWQYLLMKRPQAAVRAFDEALALEPRAEVYANLGQAHLAAGDRDAAREAFRRAVTLDPGLYDELPASIARSLPRPPRPRPGSRRRP